MANNHSNFAIIRVTPALNTGAYADNDVFFDATAIPNAVRGNNGCSLLHAITIINEDDVVHDHDIVFMDVQKNLGTINSAVGSGRLNTSSFCSSTTVSTLGISFCSSAIIWSIQFDGGIFTGSGKTKEPCFDSAVSGRINSAILFPLNYFSFY